MRASSNGPLTDGSNASRNQASPTPLPSEATRPASAIMGRLGLNGVCGQIRGLPEAEALRLAFLLEFHRTFGLHLLRLDFAVSRLRVAIVARQVVVLALNFGNLLQPRVVGTLLGAEVVSQCRSWASSRLVFSSCVASTTYAGLSAVVDGVDGSRLSRAVGSAVGLASAAFSASIERRIR